MVALGLMKRSTPDVAGDRGAQAIGSRAVAALRALRIHQWTKNALVFVPVLGAHRIWDPQALLSSALAFFAFGFAASAVYVLNDVVDVEADRLHPRKRLRPFASGQLPRSAALLLVPALLLAAVAVGSALPLAFTVVLGGYLALTSTYSFALKLIPLVDVFVLALLYTSRLYAGAFATGIPISDWLASFSIFLFLSLAFLKRATELMATGRAPRRGYVAMDRESVFTMGISGGYLSALVLALYVSSPETRRLYPSPAWLWALGPLVLFWVSHVWLRARRGEMDDDPLVFALSDKVTWVVALIGSIFVLAATRGGP